MTTTLICIGAGYSALPIAAWAQSMGWTVIGTSRSVSGCERLVRYGLKPILFDGATASAELAAALRAASHVLVSVPPETDGRDPVIACHTADLSGSERLGWVGYLSTVGVYGDHGGDWVDEDTPATPQSRRSIARLEAEQAWQRAADAARWRLQIFRLAGIYGPGRSPVDRLREGTAQAIVKPGQVFNRIHVEDIRAAVIAGMSGRGSHRIYNVSDDEPAPPQEVIRYAAEQLGVTPPLPVPFASAVLSPMAASFYAENKRVRNTRLRTDLGVTLAYPTYREGIAALL